MFSRAALMIFALAVAEYFVFGFAAGLVGTSTVVWISVAAALLGFIMIRRSLAAMLSSRVQSVQRSNRPQSPPPVRRSNADHGLLVLAGILLVLPGLVTGAVGAALVLPPVRALVRARVRHRIDAVVSRGLSTNGFTVSFADGAGFFGRRDVVDVDLNPDSSTTDTVKDDGPTTAPPELH